MPSYFPCSSVDIDEMRVGDYCMLYESHHQPSSLPDDPFRFVIYEKTRSGTREAYSFHVKYSDSDQERIRKARDFAVSLESASQASRGRLYISDFDMNKFKTVLESGNMY